jgi:hypothetical protein
MLNFPDEFRPWLARALDDGVPAGVIGFVFNLYETPDANAPFGIELVGTDVFDPADPDWACAEIWEPSGRRSIAIPRSFSGADWETGLAAARSLIVSILAEPTPISDLLRSVDGVALVFVDGELEIIWSR